jgi:general secretion pathway protein D
MARLLLKKPSRYGITYGTNASINCIWGIFARLKRRDLLNTTASTRIGWVLVAIIFSAGTAAAAPPQGNGDAPPATAGSGQAASPRPDDKGQQAADLLRRARQAMAENDLAAAESLIAQSEALGVEYNSFHLGDTPKKARRDLDRKRSAAGPAKPSQLFSPLAGTKKNVPASDPFAGRLNNTPPPSTDIRQVLPLPRVDSGAPAELPAVLKNASSQAMVDRNYPSTEPNENDLALPPFLAKGSAERVGPGGSEIRIGSGSILLAARRALAVGDIRRAGECVQQAKNQNLQYGALDDTPEKVDAAIRKMQDLASLDKNTEAYRRAYSRNLMEQAEALLRQGETDEAERLCNVAAGQQVTYNLIETKPQDLLSRIASMRSNQPSSVPGAANAGAVPANTQIQPRNNSRHEVSVELVRQSREALAAGQFDRAEELARKAEQLRLPDMAFSPGEDRPELVLSDISNVRGRLSPAVVPAANFEVAQAMAVNNQKRMASAAVYDPANDPTRNIMAANEQSGVRTAPRQSNLVQNKPSTMPLPPTNQPDPTVAPPNPGNSEVASGSALSLFQQGEAALKAHDRDRAYQLFRQAATRMNELDPVVAQRLQDHLQMLSGPAQRGAAQGGGQSPTLLDETAARQQVLARQVAADLAHLEANARAMRESDPKGALSLLEEGHKKVDAAGLEPAARDQLLRRTDRAITETKQYLEENQPRLELTDKNNRTRQEIDREGRAKQDTKEKIAQKIDEFNRLRDEQRYEEAQVVAKQAAEIDPNNPVAQQLLTDAKFLYRVKSNDSLREKKEEGFWTALDSVDQSSVPFDDRKPYLMPNAQTWDALTKNRAKLTQAEHRRNRTEREIEIEKKLKTPVSLDFTNAPLSKVVDYLGKIAEINLYLDPKGLAEEGVTSDTPVNIEVRHEIMLKSALNLILQPLHLSYVVKDEVLKITSEQLRDNQVYPHTYNVADLVIPIPNFVPAPMGLSAAYHDAMGTIGFNVGNTSFGASGSPLAVVASRDGKGGTGTINPNVLAQLTSPHSSGTHTQPQQQAGGPGGLGGGTQADFDSLIQLITTTVKPSSWDSVGGQGSIAPFETNLSIVVNQTQEIHEEIVDLLEQLRRMQDLQVTIEVRFITLTDNFFERIGVNFDFTIHNNAKNQPAGFGSVVSLGQPTASPPTEPGFNTLDSSRTTSAVVGMITPGNSPSNFTSDLDIPFTQNSYGLAVPQFGGFDATAGAQMGFAILSDIEAYFFINAAQGDKRTNVLQAPKVTLFNGQQAFVSDTTQSPFVISVIPVVGDFAAAQQPVIVVLSEGTFMTVQAVISNDRRFVRLTVVPFFSHIGQVNTFTFSGSTSTTTDTTREGVQTTPNDNTKTNNASTTTNTGVTVQLPSFSFVSVTTTVSVPDGGTVLLGGIKRLSENRSEFGVPILNKIPYLNRLFKNVGVGRETQSLMMMVTPRIIIQEEEEEKLGVTTP